jgi:hypothetical protein
VEERARTLDWAAERPWTRRTHLGASDGLPLIDLHDLSVRLALDAVNAALALDLGTGGLVLVTGRGRHGGGRSPLRDAVQQALSARGLQVAPRGPGRLEVVVSPDRAKGARPGLGLLFWLVVALAVAGLLAAVFG